MRTAAGSGDGRLPELVVGAAKPVLSAGPITCRTSGCDLRYRVHQRPVPGLRRTVDVVFPGARVAVESMGCFWHSCPERGTAPRANAAWWAEKLAKNRERDADTAAALAEAGWLLIVVWEHESVIEAADLIERTVRSRSSAAAIK